MVELKLGLHCVTIITNFQDGYSWYTLIPVWHTIFLLKYLLFRAARDRAHARTRTHSPKKNYDFHIHTKHRHNLFEGV